MVTAVPRNCFVSSLRSSANFVVGSRLRLARIFIVNRPEATGRTDEIKYIVPNFATTKSG